MDLNFPKSVMLVCCLAKTAMKIEPPYAPIHVHVLKPNNKTSKRLIFGNCY